MIDKLKSRIFEINQFDSPYRIYTDVETSGKDPFTNDIISGSMILTDKDFNELDVLTFKSRPEGTTWDQEAADNSHKIKLTEAILYPHPLETIEKIDNFLSNWHEPGNPYIPMFFHATTNDVWERNEEGKAIGLRIIKNFDWAFYVAMYWKWNKTPMLFKFFSDQLLVPTVRLGRIAGFKRNRLNQWSERIGFDLKHHEDLSDTRGCMAVHKYLSNLNKPVEALI